MQTSEQINELAAALARAQAVMEGASKDATNPHFRSRYATLASVWEAARKPLTAHGLAVIQTTRAEGPAVTVETMLAHQSGQWVRDALTTTARDAGPQSVGSAISYLRRYALAAMVGIAPEDDDAEAATAPPSGYWHEAESQVSDALVGGPWRSTGPLRAVPSGDGLVYVSRVEAKPTRNKNVTRYEVIFSSGEQAATIKANLAAVAERAVNERLAVTPSTKQTKFGTELVGLRIAAETAHVPEAEPAVELDASQIPF